MIIDHRVLRRLGEIGVPSFLSRYWQREPVCLRQAIPDAGALITPERLFALAGEAAVESRLVTAASGRWRLRHGPFPRSALAPLRRAGSTLLVQGVDLHEPAVAALAARFRFLPLARFDDVMISYASDRGGVGPHVDQYDVFLLQAQGRRRWRIATHYDGRLVEDAPLRVLARFDAEREWVLDPGDMLYLPPGVAHEGVALGPCMTVSIGFRLPAWQALRDAWVERQARVAPLPGLVPDATRCPTRTPALLPAAMVGAVTVELGRRRLRQAEARREARRTLLEHLSEPKPSVVFDAPRRALGPARFAVAARQRGLHSDLRTRMLYSGGDFAINGESIPMRAPCARLLRVLANRGALSSSALCSVEARDAGWWALLHGWYRCGWLHIGIIPRRGV
jgi:50S ribosomal protein L16 3-hydroxylase